MSLIFMFVDAFKRASQRSLRLTSRTSVRAAAWVQVPLPARLTLCAQRRDLGATRSVKGLVGCQLGSRRGW